MLTYRLDKEVALVLVSAVACGEPGSASSPSAGGGARPIATIEHMTKLSKDDVAALERNLAVEWKAVLKAPALDPTTTPIPKSPKSPEEHWSDQRQRKVRRLVSEPLSPVASGEELAVLRSGD